MDGSVRDLFIGHLRVRLASQSFAIQTYPKFILLLATGFLKVDAPLDSIGARIVYMSEPRVGNLAVLSSDFERIKLLALEFGPQPRFYPTEPDSSVLDRIAARVRVLFSDRSSF